MKKLLTFLTLLTLFFGVSWAETMTYTPTTASGEGTLTGGPSDLTLTNTHSGGNSMQTGQGLQITTAKSPFTATISGLASSYKLTKIVVTYCTNNKAGKGTISAKIGDTQVGTTFNVTAPNGGGTTLKTATLYDNASGTPFIDDNNFTINITCTTNSVYLNKVEIDYEANSGPIIPTVLTPEITINPASGPYFVGDEVTASITCGTDGAAIQYQINDGSWTAYNNSPVTIPSTTAGTVTIKAKATKTDYNDSGEATASVTFANPPTTFNNLAAVNTSDDNTEFVFTAQTVVLGKYNKQLYIVMPDNSAGTLVFGDSNWSNDYTYGKDVSNRWSGTKTTYNDKPEVTSPTNFTLAGTTTEVTPIEITSNDGLTKDNFGRYAVIKNVQVAADGSFSELTTYDQFHLSFTDFEAGRYDVYGVIGWNNGVGQFMPLKYEKHKAAYTITVNQPATGGTISANAETADAGEEVTLTATPATGYELTSWNVKDADNNDVAVTDNKFTMPASNVTVTATFTAIKYAVNVNVTPANSGEVWVQGGCNVEDNVSVSTVGTTVTVKLHSYTNYQVEGILVKDANDNEIETTLTNTEADGLTYTFVMPASAVTVTGKFHAYVPDVYFLAGDLSNWDNGVKMTYDSENNKYNLRVYFSEEYGFFRFRAGDNTYASGADGDWWGLDGSTVGESATLYNGSTKRFRIPAGIYDIEVGQVFDDPTTSNNPNWWGQTTVTVTKVEPTLTFTPAAGEIVSGASVSVSSNLYELLSAINSNIAENDVTNMVKTDGEYTASVTLDAAATVTGRAKYGYIEQTATAEYTIMQENTSNKYQLSTTLTAGKKYIIVSEGKNDIMGAYNSSKSRYDVATASGYTLDTDNHIATLNDGSDVSVFTLGGSVGAWTLTDGSIYLSYSGSSNELYQSETANSDNEKWTITFDGNNAIIGNVGVEGRNIRHNSQSGIYACYTSAQTAIQLYQQTEEVVTLTVATPVITPGTGTYAEAKTVEITCSTPGATIWYKYGNMADYAEYTEALTISENTTLSAYATKDGYTDSEVATATYTFSALSDDVFTLVTSEDQLVEGNEYIIVAATSTYKPALGAIESRNGTQANGYTFETAGDYSQLTLAAESDVNILTLGKVEVSDPNDKFYWTFMQKDGKYIYVDKSGGAIDVESQSNYSNLFKISIGAGSNYNNYATIQGSPNYQIEYRDDNTKIFRHYASSNVNQTNNVYRKVLLYTRGATVTPSMTLANLCETGEPGKTYTISNEDGLLGVYSQGTSVWFKDEDGEAIDYRNPNEGDYEFYTVVDDKMGINMSEMNFDQSNWIEVVFPENANYNNKYVKNLTGTYSNENGNPKLTLTKAVAVDDVEELTVGAGYIPNPYILANFDGDQQYNGKTYFFSVPKAQEYAQIMWAVWDGEKFNMPTKNNAYGFTGSFPIEPDLNAHSLDGLQNGESYNFKAIIRKGAAPTTGAPRLKASGDSYKVYPLDLNPGTPTAISTVNVNGQVKSVKYVNVAGIVSDKPFSGVNIVVTEYTDGSRSTTKMLRK